MHNSARLQRLESLSKVCFVQGVVLIMHYEFEKCNFSVYNESNSKNHTTMKRLKTYLTVAIVMMAMAWSVNGSAQVLRDADYNSVGRIAGNGLVRDASQRSIGSFDADGTVRDKAGVARGRINRLEIFNLEGMRIGYINTDGTVHDGESNLLGTINLSDGKVTDANQKVLGFARGIRVDWIACYYFFDFFKTR